VLVIAGKGHEDYQIIGNKTLHFSDRETALRLMSTLKIR
jgi:UDP-N-acetylmuramoyl-L-alanyl-D-glutamate--2,6-diaminopimelate ligase